MDAVIDIGSNSVRLALDRGESVNPKLINTTCLADGLAKTGRLSNEAMSRTLAAIVEFASKAREERADNIYIFATEAMRSATNGGEFRSAVEKAVSLPVRVISGDAEARLGLLGAISPDTHDEITVIDIGGASVEVVRGDEKKLTYARSLPLGVVRLRDIAGDRREDIEKYVSKHITDFGFVIALIARSSMMSQNATISAFGFFFSAGMCLPLAIPPQPITPILTFSIIKSPLCDFSFYFCGRTFRPLPRFTVLFCPRYFASFFILSQLFLRYSS